MNRFVFVSLLLMAWVYWELSGGADFQPAQRPAEVAAAEPSAPAADPLLVTRAEETPIDEIAEPVAAAAPVLADPAVEAALAEAVEAPVEALVEPVAEVPVAAPADLRIVTGNRVNLRDGPGRDFTAIDQLTEGTVIEVVEESSGWVRVKVQGAETSGWMSADFLLALNG